ncbi:HTH domain-containing protein [Haloarculaceae archaeon H-GB2-1]|nr:HTH domain-containing protein [Haloarculaceae archaeon H-GB2-1]
MNERNQTTTWLESSVADLTEHDSIRLELYVRSLTPTVGIHGPQERVLERLRALDSEDVVDACTVNVWGPTSRSKGSHTDERRPDGAGHGRTRAGVGLLQRDRRRTVLR